MTNNMHTRLLVAARAVVRSLENGESEAALLIALRTFAVEVGLWKPPPWAL